MQIGEERYILGKVEKSNFTDLECGITHNTPLHSPDSKPSIQLRNNGNWDVRCLVMFTENSEAAEGGFEGISNRANMAIAQTNQALRNSNVKSCELRLESIAVVQSDFEETDKIKDDIDDFADDSDVQALRDELEADIVVLLTDGECGLKFGIAGAIDPNDNLAFAIVETDATTALFTFAHEVGHLFGGGHETDSRPGIPHGHAFNTGDFPQCLWNWQTNGTILHTLGTENRILNYSNPNVVVDGEKTEKKNTRENATQLKNEACVAQFRETIEPFGVYITGNDCNCPCASTSKHAVVFNGTGGATYTYTWETSTDGFICTISTAYTGDGISHVLSCEEGASVFFRVTAESSDGNTAVSAVSSAIASMDVRIKSCLVSNS